MSATKEQATCQGCGRLLIGDAYMYGGSAYIPGSRMEQARVNFYGGFVCSRSCDYRASLELERSMPGHSWDQSSLGGFALASIKSNWPS